MGLARSAVVTIAIGGDDRTDEASPSLNDGFAIGFYRSGCSRGPSLAVPANAVRLYGVQTSKDAHCAGHLLVDPLPIADSPRMHAGILDSNGNSRSVRH